MTRLARTSGIANLRRLFAAGVESEREGVPLDELLAAHVRPASDSTALTRRGLLLGGAGLLAGAALGARPPASGLAPEVVNGGELLEALR